MVSNEVKDQLHVALTTAFKNFTAAFEVFTDSEINKIPFKSSWSPAQVATHIILATDGVPDHTHSKADRNFDSMLPKIRPWWEDLNQKFTSPTELQPDTKVKSRQFLLTELQRVREKDLTIVAQKDLTTICGDFELPSIGFLTRYEWLWFIEMHLKRHTFQLQNMRTHFGK